MVSANSVAAASRRRSLGAVSPTRAHAGARRRVWARLDGSCSIMRTNHERSIRFKLALRKKSKSQIIECDRWRCKWVHPPMEISTVPYALVVDDDAIILMDACGILEEAGFRFYEAGTGDAAKLLLDEHNENIVLLFCDVEMPGTLDGFGLARHVAEHWPWIEIVISSGRMKPAPGDMPDKATFISKPFNAQMVHQHLREKLPDNKKPEPLKNPV